MENGEKTGGLLVNGDPNFEGSADTSPNKEIGKLPLKIEGKIAANGEVSSKNNVATKALQGAAKAIGIEPNVVIDEEK